MRKLVPLLLASALLSTASAVPVTYDFTLEITEATSLSSGHSVGERRTGSFTVDFGEPPLDVVTHGPGWLFAYYHLLGGTYEGVSTSSQSPSELFITDNGEHFPDVDYDSYQVRLSFDGAPFGSVKLHELNFSISEMSPAPTLVSGIDHPTLPPILGADASLSFVSLGPPVRGKIVAISQRAHVVRDQGAVVWLVGLGFLAAGVISNLRSRISSAATQ